MQGIAFHIRKYPPFLPAEEVKIFATDLRPDRKNPVFTFHLKEEKEIPCITTGKPGIYLYEPHAALLKSGAFKLVAERYGIQKLHRHSHLYTSAALVEDFPGRCFEIEDIWEFSGKWLRQANRLIPQANLTTRNFPLSVADIRKRSGIKDGGNLYLFATTLANERKVLIKTHKK